MEKNYSGIKKIFDKGRFMFEVYFEGKHEGTALSYDDAVRMLESKVSEKKKKAYDFADKLKHLMEGYDAKIMYIEDRFVVEFDDDSTRPIVIKGNVIDKDILTEYKDGKELL